MKLIEAHQPTYIPAVRELFVEYANWLDYDLCVQNFDKELANLPGDYAPPRGRLYLALLHDEPVGCIALRPKADTVGEIKRLYVRPAGRGLGLGKKLTGKVIKDARVIGYERLRLDTLPVMTSAIAIYREFGFKDIPPPTGSPLAGEMYMEMSLL